MSSCDTVGITCTYGTGLGQQDVNLGRGGPPPLIATLAKSEGILQSLRTRRQMRMQLVAETTSSDYITRKMKRNLRWQLFRITYISIFVVSFLASLLFLFVLSSPFFLQRFHRHAYNCNCVGCRFGRYSVVYCYCILVTCIWHVHLINYLLTYVLTYLLACY